MADNYLRLGDKLPDFSLSAFQNNKNTKVVSSSYFGKWLVLVFYPGDFTFVCPTELVEFSQNIEIFEKLGAEVLSISIDTAFVHKAWHESSENLKHISFPMGSDPTGKICRQIGVFDEEKQTAMRATYIFDPKGVLRLIEINDARVGRSVTEIYRKLVAAKHVSDHPGEVCPASWKPGKPTVKVTK